jgi:hypothetical protein
MAKYCPQEEKEFRCHLKQCCGSDILVRIRIRTTDLRILLYTTLFISGLFKGTLTSSLEDKKKVIKKSQNRRNRGFSYYFSLIMEGSGSIKIIMDPDPGGPKKGTDPTDPDPDPQHYGKH